MRHEPLYKRLADSILKEIAEGRLRPGDRLPTEEALGQRHGVSRITVREAMNLLRQQHLVERYAGRGSFITNARGPLTWTIASIDDVVAPIADTEPRIIDWKPVTPPPAVRAVLRTARESVYRLRVVRSRKGTPLYFAEVYVPGPIARGLRRADLSRRPVIGLIEEKDGLRVTRVSETISAAAADAETASRLGILPSNPILVLEFSFYGADGRPVEYAKAWCRPDQVRLENQFTRSA